MKRIVKSIIRSTGYDVVRAKTPMLKEGQGIHFLHIGKNAGTQISNIAELINGMSADRMIIKHAHDVFLENIPAKDDYFFSIRNPVSRFRSGFYSRKRKGQPRIYSEWSAHDEVAFSEFEHANDLAEALFEPGVNGHKAWAAMKSIRHTSQNQCDWFSRYGNFLRVRPPLWIIRQENFDTDIKKLIFLAFPGIDPESVEISTDNVTSHKNDYSNIPSLSPRAKENLAKWYAQDFAFYDMCNDWIEAGGNFQN